MFTTLEKYNRLMDKKHKDPLGRNRQEVKRDTDIALVDYASQAYDRTYSLREVSHLPAGDASRRVIDFNLALQAGRATILAGQLGIKLTLPKL